MTNIGKMIGDFLGFDPTPGFNIGRPLSGTIIPTWTANGSNSSKSSGTPKSDAGQLDNSTISSPSQTTDSTPTYDTGAAANTLYQINSGLDQYNKALGRLDPQQSTALANVDSSYNKAYNRLLGSQASGNQTYNTNVNNQTQDYVDSRDQIANNQRDLVLGARRLLGASGAGGGSADRYTVPTAAANQASNQNATVQQTNARNLALLTAGHNQDEQNFNNSFGDLSDQRTQNINDTKSQFAQQRSDILDAIATLTGQQALANGASYQSAMSASQPYLNKSNSILDTLDRLSAAPKVIQEKAVQLAQPNLADYIYNRFTGPVANAQAPQDTSLIPIGLLGNADDQQQNQQLFG